MAVSSDQRTDDRSQAAGRDEQRGHLLACRRNPLEIQNGRPYLGVEYALEKHWKTQLLGQFEAVS